MAHDKKNNFFENAYDDIYTLGNGYLGVLTKIGCFIKKITVAVVMFFYKIFRSVFSFIFKTIKKYFRLVVAEFKRFGSEVKSASPKIAEAGKKNIFKGISLFIKYCFCALKNHKAVVKATVSTALPVVALAMLISLNGILGGLTFALRVYINGCEVGTVRNESSYKEAEKEAKKRFEKYGSDIDISVPEYKVALTTVSGIDDKSRVCDNIISAVSENTLNGCGVYVNDEFLCVLDSEDTFNRVCTRVLGEYAERNGYTSDNWQVDFCDKITAEPGLYPDDKKMSAEEFYKNLSGNKTEPKEYTVAEDDTLSSILEKNNISEEQLKKLNKELDTSLIPEGAVLLIEEGEPVHAIKATVTYAKAELIPFVTVSQYDNRLYVGNSMVIVPGSNGQDVVSYTDTYVNGVKTESGRELVRFNAKSPVNELVKIGTKGIPFDENSNIPVSPRLWRDQGGKFIWPAPDNCFWLSQNYNPYNSHYGIDIVSSDDGSCRGRRIVAVADGVVILVTYHYSWGYYIRIDHGNGVVTGYAHALKDSFRVNVGDYVKAGQHISSIGTTGNSTGYHLHFEVWLDGVRVNPLPYVYSQYTGVAVK